MTDVSTIPVLPCPIPITDGELPDWWTITVAGFAGSGLTGELLYVAPWPDFTWELYAPGPAGTFVCSEYVTGGVAADVNDAIAAMNLAARAWRDDQDEHDDAQAALEAGATRRRP